MPEEDIEQLEYAQEEEIAEIENQQLLANQLAAEQKAEQDRVVREEESEEDKPVPMPLLLFIPMLILCIIGDLIDFFTGGTLGWLIGLVIDFILLIATGSSKSGRKQFKRIVVGLLAETIPIIDILPFRTISLIWGFIKSRSKIAAKADRLVRMRDYKSGQEGPNLEASSVSES